MSETKNVEGFERVFQLVGGHGWFQWKLLFVISLQLIVCSWHHIGYSFLGAVPDHWCLVEELKETNWTIEEIKRLSIPMKQMPGNAGLGFDKCHYYDLNYYEILQKSKTIEDAIKTVDLENAEIVECKRWEFDHSIYKSTIPSEFELVCDWRWMTAMIQSSYMAGGLVGTVTFGYVSDKFLGRRKTVLVSLSLMVVCGLAASFANSYWMYIFLRFFIAIGVSGSMQNCFILQMEHADMKARALLGLVEQIPFAVGYMMLPGLAYLFRSWWKLQLSFGILSLSVISNWWNLPESPRWLSTHGDHEGAIKYLLKIAKVNKYPEPSREELLQILRSCHQSTQEKSEETKSNSWTETLQIKFKIVVTNFKKLLSTTELKKRSFVFWTLFSTVAMVYYGLVFSTNLTSDPFLLVFLGGLMEVPAYLLAVPFVSKLGRRPTISATFILTGFCMLALSQISTSYDKTRIILAMGAKLFVTSAFAIIYLLGAELYPTEMRTTGLAVGIFMGRMGAITSPFIADLLQYVGKDLPTIIFGVSALFAGVVSFGLPETKVLEMTDQVYEVEKQAVEEQLYKKTRKMSFIDGITQL